VNSKAESQSNKALTLGLSHWRAKIGIVKNITKVSLASFLLLLSACVSSQHEPWPDAQDQMAGFARSMAAAKRYPAEASGKRGSSSCYDAKDRFGFSKNARLSFVLENVDVAYASEYGSSEIFLQTDLVAKSRDDSSARSLAAESAQAVSAESVRLDTHYTTKMPNSVAVYWNDMGFVKASLETRLKPTETAHIRVDVMRKLSSGAERLGTLWVPLDGFKSAFSKNPKGVVFRESAPLKYRGLASIETAVLCKDD
jgi:hypothetical protein